MGREILEENMGIIIKPVQKVLRKLGYQVSDFELQEIVGYIGTGIELSEMNDENRDLISALGFSPAPKMITDCYLGSSHFLTETGVKMLLTLAILNAVNGAKKPESRKIPMTFNGLEIIVGQVNTSLADACKTKWHDGAKVLEANVFAAQIPDFIEAIKRFYDVSDDEFSDTEITFYPFGVVGENEPHVIKITNGNLGDLESLKQILTSVFTMAPEEIERDRQFLARPPAIL